MSPNLLEATAKHDVATSISSPQRHRHYLHSRQFLKAQARGLGAERDHLHGQHEVRAERFATASSVGGQLRRVYTSRQRAKFRGA